MGLDQRCHISNHYSVEVPIVWGFYILLQNNNFCESMLGKNEYITQWKTCENGIEQLNFFFFK